MALLNIPDMVIADVKEHLKHYFMSVIMSKCYDRERALFLWSLPGIGKSSIVKQAADELSLDLKQSVKVREVRLGECSLLELLGILARNTETNELEYMEPPIYKEPEDENEIIIYFLDEMDKAVGQVKAAVLHLVYDHEFWTFKLPKKSIIIGAGNPESIDEQKYSKFEPELNNRFRHYHIIPDIDSWRKWAVNADLNPKVIRFLSSHCDYLYQSGHDDMEDTAFPTPRSWEAVSDYLNTFDQESLDYDWIYPDICGDVGSSAALAFIAFCKADWEFPEIKSILTGKYMKVPLKADIKYAMINNLLTYIKGRINNLSSEEWENVCCYINRFPDDYAALFYSSMIDADCSPELPMLYCKSFRRWSREHGELLVHGYTDIH